MKVGRLGEWGCLMAISKCRKFYVYVHRRLSDRSIFYVGKGIKKRLTSKASRSSIWKSIASDHGYTAEVVHGPMPEACSFSYEKALIHAIGRESLCNLTNGGGSGTTGYKFNKETVIEKSKKYMKPVINSNGDVFPSLSDAKQWLIGMGHVNATESHISNCCHGFRHVAYGLSWSFDTSKAPELIDSSYMVNIKRRRPVIASNNMVFDSISDAAEWVRSTLLIKCGTSDISRCCNNKRRLCGGLEWRYLSDKSTP